MQCLVHGLNLANGYPQAQSNGCAVPIVKLKHKMLIQAGRVDHLKSPLFMELSVGSREDWECGCPQAGANILQTVLHSWLADHASFSNSVPQPFYDLSRPMLVQRPTLA